MLWYTSVQYQQWENNTTWYNVTTGKRRTWMGQCQTIQWVTMRRIRIWTSYNYSRWTMAERTENRVNNACERERECQVDIVDGDNAAEIAGEQRGLMMTLLASERALAS
ncbi:hypothetical protein PV325_013875 [Microctonus aethiopoides]|nr:hypothetical protein PV325_013875 [Microctonus aethiopoides]KAK0092774.1 hypothetical protein PV326_000630 [Microctonus aethiopoides]